MSNRRTGVNICIHPCRPFAKTYTLISIVSNVCVIAHLFAARPACSYAAGCQLQSAPTHTESVVVFKEPFLKQSFLAYNPLSIIYAALKKCAQTICLRFEKINAV